MEGSFVVGQNPECLHLIFPAYSAKDKRVKVNSTQLAAR